MKKNSRDNKVNSKDAKRKNFDNSLNEELSGPGISEILKGMLTEMKRNKKKTAIIFVIIFISFLFFYFQYKYDQQQRFSPDSLKDHQDVSQY